MLLAGCAQTQSAESAFEGVQTLVNKRADLELVWNLNSDQDRQVSERIGAMLADELSVEQAVQIALLNNRNLQSTYEQIGISQADLVQAGLLQNPVFSLSARFPDGGGGTDLELGITQQFISLLAIPLKQRLAEAELERAQLDVAAAVLELATEVEHQVYRVQASQQLLEMHHTIAQAAGASATVAEELRRAGNITELDLARRLAIREETLLDWIDAQAKVALERERLQVLMGIADGDATWSVAPRLAELPEFEVSMDRLERLAASQRLDLLSARQELEVAARRNRLVRPFAAISDVEVGIDAERKSDGQWLTGPNVSIPIPLFDQGQGIAARGNAEYRQARHRYHAANVEIGSEVRSAYVKMESARNRAARYRSTILPLRRTIVDRTQLQYNAMQVSAFDLIQAQRDEIESGAQYVQALRDYWIAKSDLKHAVGGRLPEATLSAQPATSRQTDSHHPHHPEHSP